MPNSEVSQTWLSRSQVWTVGTVDGMPVGAAMVVLLVGLEVVEVPVGTEMVWSESD